MVASPTTWSQKMTKKGTIPSRRGTDMMYSGDPVIPMRVETLLQGIKTDITNINANITTIRDSLHSKADKSDLDKLESQVEDLRRNGSDTAKRVEAGERDLHAKVEQLQLTMATKVAVDDNTERLIDTERSSKLQWFGLLVTFAIGLAEFIVLMLKH